LDNANVDGSVEHITAGSVEHNVFAAMDSDAECRLTVSNIRRLAQALDAASSVPQAQRHAREMLRELADAVKHCDPVPWEVRLVSGALARNGESPQADQNTNVAVLVVNRRLLTRVPKR